MDKSPDQKTKPRIAFAERRVKPLARLLRCATTLRVTPFPRCGSRRWPGQTGEGAAATPHPRRSTTSPRPIR